MGYSVNGGVATSWCAKSLCCQMSGNKQYWDGGYFLWETVLHNGVTHVEKMAQSSDGNSLVIDALH